MNECQKQYKLLVKELVGETIGQVKHRVPGDIACVPKGIGDRLPYCQYNERDGR